MNFADSLLCYAVSGLAQVGGTSQFEVDQVVAELLCRSGETAVDTPNALEKFAGLLSAEVEKLPVARVNRRISIAFAGFMRAQGTSNTNFVGVVSNFEDLSGRQDELTDEFCLDYVVLPANTVTIRCVGSGELREPDATAIAELLGKHLAPKNVAPRAVEAIRLASTRSPTVGARCSATFIGRGDEGVAWCEYYSDVVDYKTFSPAYVYAKWDESGAYCATRGQAEGFDASGQPLVLKVGKVRRNAPCPCGSKLKYKKCHARPNQSRFGPVEASALRVVGYAMTLKMPKTEVDLPLFMGP